MCRWLVAGGLAVALLAGGGCSRPAVSDIPYGTAADMVEQSLQDAITALAPARPKEDRVSGILEGPCGSDFGSAATDDEKPALIERTYQLGGVDPAASNQTFDRLKRYWATHGYRLVRDDGPAALDGSRWMTGQREDGFYMTFIQGVGGQLTLRAQSVCVRTAA
jgi:hypothetical protein